MCSKDNPKMVSSVAAINREKKDRIEHFFNQISVIGAAIIFIGGMGGKAYGDYHMTAAPVDADEEWEVESEMLQIF